MKNIKQVLAACEKPLLDLRDFLKDKSLRVIGIVGDKNQGKSLLMYEAIRIIHQDAPETKVVGFRMSIKAPEMLMLNTLTELSKVSNSVIFIDELKTDRKSTRLNSS